jgi:hypothetical protein
MPMEDIGVDQPRDSVRASPPSARHRAHRSYENARPMVPELYRVFSGASRSAAPSATLQRDADRRPSGARQLDRPSRSRSAIKHHLGQLDKVDMSVLPPVAHDPAGSTRPPPRARSSPRSRSARKARGSSGDALALLARRRARGTRQPGCERQTRYTAGGQRGVIFSFQRFWLPGRRRMARRNRHRGSDAVRRVSGASPARPPPRARCAMIRPRRRRALP